MKKMTQKKFALRQKQPSPTESLRLERKNLLTVQNDFQVQEAYKTLRTNVLFTLISENDSKVILVTSSLPSEGKSINSTNLAISLTQLDKKVLLVDCDLRRPKMARLLGLHADVGLSNVLMRPELTSSAILSTRESGLSVMLSGDVPPNPSELLSSERMRKFLDGIKEIFDYIILDTPPINVVADAAILSPLVDGVLFVVRARQSERNAVKRAVEQLRRADAKLLGFVLNDVQNIHYNKYGYSYAEAE